MNEPQPVKDVPQTSAGAFLSHITTLLTVAGLIGLFALLVFPALAHVRTARDRAFTDNYMQQFTLAIHNYHDANAGHFPLACDFGPGSTKTGRLSLHFLILPYTEGANVAQTYTGNPATYDRPASRSTPPGAAG